MDIIQKRNLDYLDLQQILESNTLSPITQAITQCIKQATQNWDIKYAETLLIQCGSGHFFRSIAQTIEHLSVIEPCAKTYIALQHQYLHVSFFGNNIVHMNADAKSFDYSIMLYPALYMQDISNSLEEILRVTSQSVVFLFFNMVSMGYCYSRMNKKSEGRQYIWHNPYRLMKTIYSIQKHANIVTISMGLLPLELRKQKQHKYWNYSYPVCSITAFRVDIPKTTVMTPLVKPITTERKTQLHWGTASSRST